MFDEDQTVYEPRNRWSQRCPPKRKALGRDRKDRSLRSSAGVQGRAFTRVFVPPAGFEPALIPDATPPPPSADHTGTSVISVSSADSCGVTVSIRPRTRTLRTPMPVLVALRPAPLLFRGGRSVAVLTTLSAVPEWQPVSAPVAPIADYHGRVHAEHAAGLLDDAAREQVHRLLTRCGEHAAVWTAGRPA